MLSIFLRSIRRRLVTGYGVALGLQLVLAWFAWSALNQHLTAVDRLEYLVDRHPDRDRLCGIVAEIQKPFTKQPDLTKNEAIRNIRTKLNSQIDAAWKETDRFWKLSDNRPAAAYGTPDLGRKSNLNNRMPGVYEELKLLRRLTNQLTAYPDMQLDDRGLHFNDLQLAVGKSVSTIVSSLRKLPDDTYVATSLHAEALASRQRVSWVWTLIAIAFVSNLVTFWCAMKWIVNPTRELANGAWRIAEVNHAHRLERVTPWNDEFTGLTEKINYMADRFTESERDLEAKVEERSRQLVRSERLASIGIFSAGLAHEINSPLSAISMATGAVQLRILNHMDLDHPDTIAAMQKLNMIEKEAKRCGEITHNMLGFSREETTEKRRDDLTRVVGEVVALVRPMKKYADCAIRFDTTQPMMAEFNTSQIKQVVLNLLVNAIQATKNQGEVSVQLTNQADALVLQIADNGEGMTAENQEQLFEPFYSTKETGEGTGLGLSITNRIVEEHNGTIEPFSEGPGKGSVFTVRLPKRQPAAKAA